MIVLGPVLAGSAYRTTKGTLTLDASFSGRSTLDVLLRAQAAMRYLTPVAVGVHV